MIKIFSPDKSLDFKCFFEIDGKTIEMSTNDDATNADSPEARYNNTKVW